MAAGRRDPRFETTRWSLVVAAGGSAAPTSRDALGSLVEQYWYPLYAYLRRAGYGVDDAEDLTQGFFVRLMEKDVLQAANPDRGRFRSFLLAALKNFAANEWQHRHAQKRGGVHQPISLDISSGARRYQLEPRLEPTPEALYDRQWALTVLDRALGRLRAELSKAGKATLFERLHVYLVSSESAPPYAETAAACGMTEGALKVAVHRLRKRCGDLLREEIAGTVATPEELEDEIRYMISLFGPNPPGAP